jgi:hypothetical protein
MSCGCKQPNETHSDDRNITLRDLEQAAAAAGTDVQGVMKNFKQDFELVGVWYSWWRTGWSPFPWTTSKKSLSH